MLISCPRGHRKVHDSRGYWFQNVGIDLFSWNKEIFAIYSHSTNTRTILFPQKQRPSTLKKDQWTVIVLSFLGRVSFPVLHQLWQLSQWQRRQDLCICIVSVRVAKFSLLATLSLSPSHILSVFMVFSHLSTPTILDHYCSSIQSFLSSIKPKPLPVSENWRRKQSEQQKRALMSWTCFLMRTRVPSVQFLTLPLFFML